MFLHYLKYFSFVYFLFCLLYYLVPVIFFLMLWKCIQCILWHRKPYNITLNVFVKGVLSGFARCWGYLHTAVSGCWQWWHSVGWLETAPTTCKTLEPPSDEVPFRPPRYTAPPMGERRFRQMHSNVLELGSVAFIHTWAPTPLSLLYIVNGTWYYIEKTDVLIRKCDCRGVSRVSRLSVLGSAGTLQKGTK